MRSAVIGLAALALAACSENDDGGGGPAADVGPALALDAGAPVGDAVLAGGGDAAVEVPDDADAAPGAAVTPEDEYAADPVPYAAPPALGAEIPGAGDTEPDCEARYLAGLRGWIVDRIGNPISGAKAQICVRRYPSDELRCLFPATSGDDGVFEQEVPDTERCMRRASMRVLHPRMSRATLYCDVDLSALDGAGLRIESPFVLFPTAPATDLPPTGDDQAARTVVFADGLELRDVIPRQFYATAESYEALSVWRVPTDERGLCMLQGVPAMDGLYAFYPEGDVTDGVYPVRIPNASGLPAGAEVELFVLGGLDCTLLDGSLLPEGVWQNVGAAHVSADGATVDSDDGVGLPCLTWLGYRETDGG